ncbi:MAG: hypothetical protein KCHDKBKB_01624 [Elusimicrobia bacterium]|nr:hypothetical protein [Elusimicrobiota bacterium]
MSNQRKFGYTSFEKWEVKLAKKKARRLIGKFGFTQEDAGDLEQELLLHIFLRKKGGSAAAQLQSKGKSVMGRILDNRIRDLIEKAKSKKREGQLKSDSLHRELGQGEEGESVTYEDILSEDDSFGRSGKRRLAEEEEIRLALGSALGKLTSFQRRVCRLLMTYRTVDKVATAVRMKRPTLYLEINRIRAVFDEEGLGGYI